MTWCQKHLAKTLNQTVFHLYIFLCCSFIFYLFWVLWVLKCFQRLYFEEKSSYGLFWKINFCHLSFLFPHNFNLFTFHKTCEHAATSVHEKSSQNKRQRLGCCAAKVICPRLQDWVLVLSSVNWAFPPLSSITPTLLSFPHSQIWTSSNAFHIKKTLLVGCAPEVVDWYCSINLFVIRARLLPVAHSEVFWQTPCTHCNNPLKLFIYLQHSL